MLALYQPNNPKRTGKFLDTDFSLIKCVSIEWAPCKT
jgi:hypothetical protein